MSILSSKDSDDLSQLNKAGECETIKRDNESLANFQGFLDLLARISENQLLRYMNDLERLSEENYSLNDDESLFLRLWTVFCTNLKSGQLVDYYHTGKLAWVKCVCYGDFNNVFKLYPFTVLTQDDNFPRFYSFESWRGSLAGTYMVPKILPHGILASKDCILIETSMCDSDCGEVFRLHFSGIDKGYQRSTTVESVSSSSSTSLFVKSGSSRSSSKVSYAKLSFPQVISQGLTVQPTKASSSSSSSDRVSTRSVGMLRRVMKDLDFSYLTITEIQKLRYECDETRCTCRGNCVDGECPNEVCSNSTCTITNRQNGSICGNSVMRFKEVVLYNRSGGVLAARNFYQGEIILNYLGEVVKSCDLDDNEGARKMSLNYDVGYVIDASRKGNELRFIKHSRQPNCSFDKICLDGVAHYFLVADVDIEGGTELTVNKRLYFLDW